MICTVDEMVGLEPSDDAVQDMVELGWQDFFKDRPSTIWFDCEWYWFGWGMAGEAADASDFEFAMGTDIRRAV